MENKVDNKRVLNAFFWKTLENTVSQGIQLVISIILARLLSPSEYGDLAIMMIFISFANMLIQNGFATALIQKHDTDIIDYSSVFYFNIFISAIIYILLYIFSPWISQFYKSENIHQIFRVISIIVFPAGIISTQIAYISKYMKFKALFIATFISSVISGFISIWAAMKSFGIWALVYQQIAYHFVLMLCLFIFSDFKLRNKFSIMRIRELFKFGSRILIASIIDNIFNNLHGLVIGKVYTKETLANYNRGEQFPKLMVSNLGAVIQSVILPIMSKEQFNNERLKEILKSSVILSSYIAFPIMFGLAATADNLINVLLGDKWMNSVIFMRLICMAYAFWPIHICNLQAINAKGRSDIFLKLEIFKKLLSLIILIIGISYGAIALVALKILADFISTFINGYPNKKLLGYGILEQYKDIFPIIVISCIMGICVYYLQSRMAYGVFSLFIEVIIGVTIYFLLSVMLRLKSYYTLKEIVYNKFRRK